MELKELIKRVQEEIAEEEEERRREANRIQELRKSFPKAGKPRLHELIEKFVWSSEQDCFTTQELAEWLADDDPNFWKLMRKLWPLRSEINPVPKGDYYTAMTRLAQGVDELCKGKLQGVIVPSRPSGYHHKPCSRFPGPFAEVEGYGSAGVKHWRIIKQ